MNIDLIQNLDTLALLGPLGWPELIVLGILGVLIFGRRLPEVGRSIGKGIVEFKKGLSGIDSDAEATANQEPPRLERPEQSQSIDAKTDEPEPVDASQKAKHSSA